MIRRLFLDHPDSVGESYTEHFGVATRFGWAMVVGGAACMLHGFVPAVFRTTGSRTVIRLHERLVAKRAAAAADQLQMKTVEYII